MADNRKEQQRAELHRMIWNIATDLRGSVDGWDFKQYVLGMLFYRYISENLTDYINRGEHEAGNSDFDYAQLSDAEAEEAERAEEDGGVADAKAEIDDQGAAGVRQDLP